MAIDAATVATAFVSSYYLHGFYFRKVIPGLGLKPLGQIDHYLWILLATIPIWWLMLFLNDAYRPKVERPAAIILLALRAGAGGLLLLGLLLFLVKFETFNRSLLVLFVFTETGMLIVTRIAVSSWVAIRRRAGKSTRHALVVGCDEPHTRRQTALLVERMQRDSAHGVVPVGFLTLGTVAPSVAPNGVPFRGTIEELPDLLHEEVVDEVYFVLPPSMLEQIGDNLRLCEEMGVEGKVLAELYRPALARPYLENSFDLPFFSFSPTPLYVGQRSAKGLLDFVGALALLALLALPMALIALVIKAGCAGPVLFRQERGGRHGRRFVMYKFRTMIAEAEKQQGQLAERNEMSGPVFKLTNDPRVTHLGRWLRRLSLDEIPQLINVLKGDMSLVGPRPLPLAESAQIKGSLRRRFSMKPGMTGLWQCSGRSTVDFDEWMRLDLEYVDNWSLRLDLQILQKTVFAVLSRKGAH